MPMKDAAPRSIRREDYRPPNHRVEHIELTFELEDASTRVVSRLSVRPHPEGTRGSALVLNGEGLELEDIRLQGLPIEPSRYQRTETGLTLFDPPEGPFQLELVTRINPSANTALEGLYLSEGFFCTQCEAEGFRRITYFPDRPDVMSLFTTTLIADKTRYPVLLSNGNLKATGDLLGGRHFARWEDPHPKPAYLFALVAGALECLEDQFVTQSGRAVTLRIFAEGEDIGKCIHALESLKEAMRWDELRFGREYDLDLYMIVAVKHFNMGAMENKGLNLFNTKYVLASPETATDEDYEHIEGVIGHEYFHNWTGNRITLRDWFQLSLKEGLTVYRDQEFSADRHSRAVKRIDEVNQLRNRQFAEDAGPLAHPVRPDTYIEINNFYTLTVYEKGAEVVRMLETLFGREGFRRGMDLYFERHDGQAVTCDDFLDCMALANNRDLGDFSLWYAQAGTPVVTVEETYEAATQTLKLHLRQSCPPTPGQPDKKPLLIPCSLGLIGPDGAPVYPQRAEDTAPFNEETRVVLLSKADTEVTLKGVPEGSLTSLFRGFSAPIRLVQSRTAAQLAFQFSHDRDPFNAWNAGQLLAIEALIGLYHEKEDQASASLLVEAYAQILGQASEDLASLALRLTLPGLDYVGTFLEGHDPLKLSAVHRSLQQRLAESLLPLWRAHYAQHHVKGDARYDPQQGGRRRFKNLCLDYLGASSDAVARALAMTQFEQSQTMTDRIAALKVMVQQGHEGAPEALLRFYEAFRSEDLVICKWLALQAAAPGAGTLDVIKGLMDHPAFDLASPNHVRSLIGTFGQANPTCFHQPDGSGYRFMAACVLQMDRLNPQVAARLLTSLTPWRRFDEARQLRMREALDAVVRTTPLSGDVYEVASKALA